MPGDCSEMENVKILHEREQWNKEKRAIHKKTREIILEQGGLPERG